jgi:uncharacterized membrane protein
MNTPKSTQHWSWKISTPLLSAIIICVFFIGFIGSDGTKEKSITTILLLLAILVGWIFGTGLTPESTREAGNFSTAWKGASLFISGYLISKIDPVITRIFSSLTLSEPESTLTLLRALCFLTNILAAMLLVYFLRMYCFGVGWEPHENEDGA